MGVECVWAHDSNTNEEVWINLSSVAKMQREQIGKPNEHTAIYPKQGTKYKVMELPRYLVDHCRCLHGLTMLGLGYMRP